MHLMSGVWLSVDRCQAVDFQKDWIFLLPLVDEQRWSSRVATGGCSGPTGRAHSCRHCRELRGRQRRGNKMRTAVPMVLEVWRHSLSYVISVGPGSGTMCSSCRVMVTLNLRELRGFTMFVGSSVLETGCVRGGVWGGDLQRWMSWGCFRVSESADPYLLCAFALKRGSFLVTGDTQRSVSFKCTIHSWTWSLQRHSYAAHLLCLRASLSLSHLWFHGRKVPFHLLSYCDSLPAGVQTSTVPQVQVDGSFDQDSGTLPPHSSLREVHLQEENCFLLKKIIYENGMHLCCFGCVTVITVVMPTWRHFWVLRMLQEEEAEKFMFRVYPHLFSLYEGLVG